MRYKCTLLKDLPDHKAGTEFKVVDAEAYDRKNAWKKVHAYRSSIGYASLIDNPDWVKKEVDLTCLFDFVCEKCGDSKWFIRSHPYSKRDDDVREYYVTVNLDCPCGNTKLLETFYAGY